MLSVEVIGNILSFLVRSVLIYSNLILKNIATNYEELVLLPPGHGVAKEMLSVVFMSVHRGGRGPL